MTDRPPVLLVVKRERNSELMDRLLDTNGYTVRAASTMAETDDLLADADDVTVAVFDVDGFSREIVARIRALDDDGVPLVLLARTIDDLRSHSLDHVAATTLEKPVSKRGLLDALQFAVEENPSSAT